ncbi:phosphoribosylglycinamide formyltransferase [Marinibaculum pumilum]|uniref:Phosphoribosylglycinamide formyltransferase n=1 Tax=Marinibaculum pumilum TaxID=1766165 RepID=A0ABV7KWG7_9PROT
MARLRTAVLVSGRGSNMAALMEACADPAFPAEIVGVISNNRDAAALQTATDAGIPALHVEHRGRSREDFEAELHDRLQGLEAGFLCNAGFMRILTAGFVDRWLDRHLNIHPSLLPAYKGLHVHERAIADGVRFSGCTVHFVRAEMDAGPIVVQAAVPVHGGDTAESLAARVLQAEHRIYPLALRWAGEGRLRVEGQRVIVDGAADETASLLNPVR